MNIVPIIRTAIPFAQKAILHSAKFAAISFAVTHAFNRSFKQKGDTSSVPNFVFREAQNAKESLGDSVKRYGAGDIMLGVGTAVFPVAPVLGVGLTIGGLVLPFWLSAHEAKKARNDTYAWVDVDDTHVRKHAKADDDGVDYTVDEVDYEGERIDIEFTDLDVQRARRVPGSVGHDFGQRYGDDPAKATHARYALKHALRDAGIDSRKIQQALVGFDREVEKLQAV